MRATFTIPGEQAESPLDTGTVGINPNVSFGHSAREYQQSSINPRKFELQQRTPEQPTSRPVLETAILVGMVKYSLNIAKI